MSRFLLILVFVAWMAAGTHVPGPHAPPPGQDVLIHCGGFLSGFVLLVASMRLWSRWLSRRVDHGNFTAYLKRFNRGVSFARLAVPGWFFVGVFFLDWTTLINYALVHSHLHPDRFESPGLLIGCLPAFFAWIGLWWSQYPADVCFREQGLLSQVDAGMPVHQPPTLGSYLRANLRLQLLFTAIPILALVAMRDVISLSIAPFGLNERDSLGIQLSVSIVTAAIAMLFAPELLRRILQTEPMPDGPIRQRMADICRRHNIRYKDVLLWRTDHNMGNAAVMGLIPHTRYILMSDLLLETMNDEQIEAVFAHEIGHIIHRHILWFAIFFGTVMFALVGLSGPAGDWIDRITGQSEWPAAIGTLLGFAGGFSLFLFLSRKFERQADVFAARTIQEESEPPADASHVGPHGASVFSSALHQVARINCIPVEAWSWCHGSIARRMEYLESLSADPQKTAQFDRFMARLYGILTAALFAFGVWAMVTLAGQHNG